MTHTYTSYLQIDWGPQKQKKQKKSDMVKRAWNTQDEFERILKFHSITTLTKYISSKPLLFVPDIDDWDKKIH